MVHYGSKNNVEHEKGSLIFNVTTLHISTYIPYSHITLFTIHVHYNL